MNSYFFSCRWVRAAEVSTWQSPKKASLGNSSRRLRIQESQSCNSLSLPYSISLLCMAITRQHSKEANMHLSKKEQGSIWTRGSLHHSEVNNWINDASPRTESGIRDPLRGAEEDLSSRHSDTTGAWSDKVVLGQIEIDPPEDIAQWPT